MIFRHVPHKMLDMHGKVLGTDSGVARAFLDGRLAHPENQNEGESSEKLRKMRENTGKNEEMFLILPT